MIDDCCLFSVIPCVSLYPAPPVLLSSAPALLSHAHMETPTSSQCYASLSHTHTPLLLPLSLQDGKNMFPSPLPKTLPPPPVRQPTVAELKAAKAAEVSPFNRTMTNAGVYTTGQIL